MQKLTLYHATAVYSLTGLRSLMDWTEFYAYLGLI